MRLLINDRSEVVGLCQLTIRCKPLKIDASLKLAKCNCTWNIAEAPVTMLVPAALISNHSLLDETRAGARFIQHNSFTFYAVRSVPWDSCFCRHARHFICLSWRLLCSAGFSISDKRVLQELHCSRSHFLVIIQALANEVLSDWRKVWGNLRQLFTVHFLHHLHQVRQFVPWLLARGKLY